MVDTRTRQILHLALTPGIGGVSFRNMLEYFGSVEAALAAGSEALAQLDGFGRKRAEDVARARDQVRVDEEIRRAEECGAGIVAFGGPGYPVALTYLASPPPVLYVRGTLVPEDARAFAIVGSRKSSLYGQEQAERFAAGLAGAGFTIVSGLARGIDICAHRGAIAGGGRTIAVLGNGLADIYPPEHKKAADEIAQHGAVISEFPIDVGPTPENFPRRNRIISGLSLGVLVVEAGQKSGAMITASTAAEQGKDVFAIPGRIDSPFAVGPHRLIQDGAKLVQSLADILDEYSEIALPGAKAETAAVQKSLPLSPRLHPQEEAILGALAEEPLTVDQIAASSGLSVTAVAAQMTLLELKHLVRPLPGQRFARNS
jgi:DNA processing protein